MLFVMVEYYEEVLKGSDFMVFSTPMEYRYQKTVKAIGWALILFLLFFNIHGVVLFFLSSFLDSARISDVWKEVIYELIYGFGYFLSFILPVGLLKRKIKRYGFPYQPIRSGFQLSVWLIPIFFAGMALIWAQSYFNAALVSIFNYSEFSNDVLWQNSGYLEGYQIVLQFIIMCIVPGICEEFLFRGAILTNLLPFGRGTAILVSALLFGMMHQNAEQILYAFGAGLILGYLYEKTGNIWNCIFLHLINNFASLANQVFVQNLGGIPPDLASLIFEGVFFLFGMICIPILVIQISKKKDPLSQGCFGKSIAQSEDFIPSPVEPKRQIRLFFNLPMILFFVFAIIEILFLLGSAVFYNAV